MGLDGRRPRRAAILTAGTAPEVIRARHRAEVAEYARKHPEASPDEISAALILPLWNVRRALEAVES